MAAKFSAEHKKLWQDLVSRTHQDQAVWFLNAFWNGGIKEHVEDVWGWVLKFAELSKSGNGTPSDLDEFFSHKFLETVGETMTVLQLRATLAELDIDKNKRMCISEYLLFKYKQSPIALVTAPQGDSEDLAKAQRLYDEATAALDDVLARLEAQKEAARKSAEAEKAAQDAEQAAKEALAELQAQEKAFQEKLSSLEQKSNEGGVVSRNRAKAELEQLKAEDPLPLKRAKLNQEAAVRKSEKARKQAEETRAREEEMARQLEIASKEAEAKRDEAVEFLNKVKNSGSGAGKVWWLQREMYEKQKFLPKAKQTMAYPKA
jgi:chemotaxis protein histidine kinase CheA